MARPFTAPNTFPASGNFSNFKKKIVPSTFVRCSSSPGGKEGHDYKDLTKRISQQGPQIAKGLRLLASSDGQTVALDRVRLVLEEFCPPVSRSGFQNLLRTCQLSHDGHGLRRSQFLDSVIGHRSPSSETKHERGPVRTIEDLEVAIFAAVGENPESVCRGLHLFDLAHDGLVRTSEFQSVVTVFCDGRDASSDLYRKFWRRYDPDDIGLVRYGELLNKMAANAVRYKRSLGNVNMKLALTWPDATEMSVKDERIRRVAILRQVDDPRLKGLALNEIHKLVLQQARANREYLDRLLRVFDQKGEGRVSLKEFRSAVVHFTYPMSEALFLQILRGLNVDAENSRLDWPRALDALCGPEGLPSQPVAKPSTAQTVDRDLEAILRRCPMDPSLRKAFTVDGTLEGPTITRQELRLLLARRGCPFTDSQWRRFAAHLDPGHGNLVSFDSFRRLMDAVYSAEAEARSPAVPSSPIAERQRRSMAPHVLVSRLKRELDRDHGRIRTALRACDPEQKGWLSTGQLRRALEAFCFRLTDREFQFVLRLASSCNGIVERDRFTDAFRLTDRERLVEWSSTVNAALRFRTVKISGERAVGLFRQMACVDAGSILRTLEKEDCRGDGTVTKRSFRSVLDRHACRLDESQFESVWQSLCPDSGESIDYSEAIRRAVRKGTPRTPQADTPQRPSTTRAVESLSLVQEQPSPVPLPPDTRNREPKDDGSFREILLRDWRQIFRRLQRTDTERHGVVPWQAFRDTMAARGIRIESSPLAAYGLRPGAPVNYVRFLRQFFLGSEGGRAQRVVSVLDDGVLRELVDRLRPAIAACWWDLKREFRRRGCALFLDTTAFRDILATRNIVLSDEDFYSLMEHLDCESRGRIRHRDFLRLFLDRN